MCGICGFWGEGNIKEMLELLHHRGPDSKGFSKIGNSTIGHARLAITGDVSQPLFSKFLFAHNGEIYNYPELRKKFNLKCKTNSDSEVFLKLIEKFYKDNVLDALKMAFKKINGCFAIALGNENAVYLSRDFLGIKPLFYSENPFAFASEKKVLWKLGYKNVKRVEPGEILKFNGKLKRYKVKTKIFGKMMNEREKILKKLNFFLEKSIYLRCRNQKKVGILFSGGIDSSLVAKIAKKFTNPILYTVGTENSQDLEWAEKVSKILNLPLKTKVLDTREIKKSLPKILWSIENCNLMNVSIAATIYYSTKLAKLDGVRVCLSGGGADELFGGYKRYERQYMEKRLDLAEEVKNLYKTNLERDDFASMANSVEIRYPYLDLNIVKIALSIPQNFLFEGQRKQILRDLGEKYLPEEVSQRPKKAAQYGSGIQREIVKISKKEGEDYLCNVWKKAMKNMGVNT